MKANVFKSENGTLVAVMLNNNILLELDGEMYIFTNPDDPRVFAGGVRQIEWDMRQTPEDIIKTARNAYNTQKEATILEGRKKAF